MFIISWCILLVIMSLTGKLTFDKDVKVNKENSIQRIRSDYNFPWIGLLRETIQNSTDGWGYNRVNGNIPESRELVIEFELDTKNKTLKIQDNAGGMTEETFRENLLAIDNPSTDKADGNGAGSYGRGFWVIMSTGTEAEIETHHTTGIYSSAVTTKGRYKTISNLDEPVLSSGCEGTTYNIYDIKEEDMRYLSDWERVEEVMIENFAPLLNDSSVTIEYTIDGEMHVPEAPNLAEMKEKFSLCEKDEIEPFSYHEEEHQIKNFVMIDATKMEEKPPWHGIVLYKGNDYLDYPFMKVDDYESRGVPSMRNPPKMFGWCDASDLCRPREDGQTLENNAHDKIQLNRVGDKTNLQKEVYKLHEEHFKTNYTTQEKDKLFNSIQDSLNSIMDKFNNFSNMSTMGGNFTGKNGNSSNASITLSFLRCKTDKVEIEVGEDIKLGIELNPRENLDYETYTVCDMQVKNVTEDEVVHQIESEEFELYPNNPVEQIIDVVSFEEEGKYTFSASVMGGESVKDKSTMTFIVGDMDEDTVDKDKGDSEGAASFLTDINTFAGDEDSGRAYITEVPDRGLILQVNTNWPTLIELQKEHNNFKEEQFEMFLDWAVDAVVDYWVEQELQSMDISGEQLDIVRESIKMRENMEKEWVLSK